MALLSETARQLLKDAGKEDLATGLDKAHASLEGKRLDFVDYGDPTKLKPKQLAKLNCKLLRQVLLHRAESLMAAAIQMFETKNLYGLAPAVRGHMETLAVLGYFTRRLQSLENGNIQFDQFELDIANGLMGAKDDIFDQAKSPVNIMTCIEHLDKYLDTEIFGEKKQMFHQLYSWLSEFAHPNFCSNKTAFTLDKETGRMVIRKGDELREDHIQMVADLKISANTFSVLIDQFATRVEMALPDG